MAGKISLGLVPGWFLGTSSQGSAGLCKCYWEGIALTPATEQPGGTSTHALPCLWVRCLSVSAPGGMEDFSLISGSLHVPPCHSWQAPSLPQEQTPVMGQSSGTSSSPTGAFLSSQPALLAPQLMGKKPPLQRPLAEQAQKLLLPTQILSNTVSHPSPKSPFPGPLPGTSLTTA